MARQKKLFEFYSMEEFIGVCDSRNEYQIHTVYYGAFRLTCLLMYGRHFTIVLNLDDHAMKLVWHMLDTLATNFLARVRGIPEEKLAPSDKQFLRRLRRAMWRMDREHKAKAL